MVPPAPADSLHWASGAATNAARIESAMAFKRHPPVRGNDDE
jgi:hypothetical protein